MRSFKTVLALLLCACMLLSGCAKPAQEETEPETKKTEAPIEPTAAVATEPLTLPTTEPEPEMPVLEIGQIAKTDMVEFTMTDCKFTDRVGLDSSNWLMPNSGSGGLSAGDGKVFVWFSFSAKNLDKETLSGYDVCNVYVDYNDGYIYDDATYSWGYNWSTSSTISKNVGLVTIDPLDTKAYYGYIKCVDAVKTDREAPLLLVVTLPSTDGDVRVAYRYAAPEGADTSEAALNVSKALNNAVEELSFVEKYAGNVNGKGSRKFADSKIESVQTSLSGIDMNYVMENLPVTAELLPRIQERIDLVCELLVDMGETNSDENVDLIKQTAREAIDMINELLASELAAFN